jgi:hypothetical protein
LAEAEKDMVRAAVEASTAEAEVEAAAQDVVSKELQLTQTGERCVGPFMLARHLLVLLWIYSRYQAK